jgi:VanZ like family
MRQRIAAMVRGLISLPGAAAALILVLTLAPLPGRAADAFIAVDTAVQSGGDFTLFLHFGLFAMFGASFVAEDLRLGRYASGAPSTTANRVLTVLAIGLAFAALDEQLQRFAPGHGPEFIDWVADSLGVAAGYACALLALRLASVRRVLSR